MDILLAHHVLNKRFALFNMRQDIFTFALLVLIFVEVPLDGGKSHGQQLSELPLIFLELGVILDSFRQIGLFTLLSFGSTA